jgi:hypothetical protein
MRVFCVCSEVQFGNAFPAYYDHVLASLAEAGALVVEEREFLAHVDEVEPSDKVVGFFTTHELSQAVYSTVRPENRWTYLVDT